MLDLPGRGKEALKIQEDLMHNDAAAVTDTHDGFILKAGILKWNATR